MGDSIKNEIYQVRITINDIACSSLDDVRKVAPQSVWEFIAEFLDDKPYIMAHTSGSTGKPKPISLAKSDMKASARFTNRFFGLTSQSTLHLCLSPDYIAGKMMLVRALESGANIVIEKPGNRPLAHYQGSRISLAAFVPSQIPYLVQNPDRLAMVDAMIVGGGKLVTRWQKSLTQLGAKAYLTYGMTETCSHVALAPVADTPQPYTALGDVHFDVDGNDCLIIDVPHFTNSHFETRDVVQLIDSRHFYWKGRFDNVIVTGGVKVHPEEVEAKIAPLMGDKRFYITSAPSDKWGDEVVLVVENADCVGQDRVLRPLPNNLEQEFKNLLSRYSVPKLYVELNKFDSTSSGKVIRKTFNPDTA